MTNLIVHLKPAEMAALIDGRTVDIETNDRTITLHGSVPDWDA